MNEDWPDPHAKIVGQAIALAEVGEMHPHRHRQAQLLYVISGVVTVEADAGIWTVPPSCAIWIPGGCLHTAHVVGQASVGCLYIDPDASASLRPDCGILFVRPLLRELILHFVAAQPGDTAGSRDERLFVVLIDELEAAPEEPLHLPMPSDRRLRRIVDAFLADPALRMTIDQWGVRVGASNRTLSRLFREQTGMPFVKWRQQLHIGLALQRLAEGERVTNVAIDLGYESLSAFIAMFKRVLGTTPARYFTDDSANELAGASLAGAGPVDVVAFPQTRTRRQR
ncbi:AraC family transcriptional regulator [Sphingomonas sp.]|uniref:AraC family transcriptional regulator n=1 Tax=Sphingomonas sp. TaxID=28214 RepID=UPI003D6DA06C